MVSSELCKFQVQLLKNLFSSLSCFFFTFIGILRAESWEQGLGCNAELSVAVVNIMLTTTKRVLNNDWGTTKDHLRQTASMGGFHRSSFCCEGLGGRNTSSNVATKEHLRISVASQESADIV